MGGFGSPFLLPLSKHACFALLMVSPIMRKPQMPKKLDQWPADKVERRKVSDLVPYAQNARTHSDTQIDQIAASMDGLGLSGQWGFCAPNDCYVATKGGDVYRVCRRQRTKSGGVAEIYETILLKGSPDKDGYRVYRMMVDGVRRHMKGHRLVAESFLGAPRGRDVNHKDGVKTNNAIANLEWCSPAENQRHAIEAGLKDPYKHNTKNQKIRHQVWPGIHAVVKSCGVRRAEVASHFGVCRQTIDAIVRKVETSTKRSA